MNRHAIIGRFGAEDKARVPVGNEERATRLEFVKANKRFDHGVGDALDDLKSFGVYPSEMGVDLLIFAAHIHAADTRISRSSESQDSWTREIRLVVPVASPEKWNTAIPILQSMLNFLTGDRWTFSFRPRPKGFANTVSQKPLVYQKPEFDGVSLFSGGLDSLVGAINSLEGGLNPLFASHAGEGAVSASQEQVFRYLETKYPKRPFRRLRMWMNFPHGLVEDSASEDSTRGRSFLFIAAATFAASGFERACRVQVPENGLIALNVPLDQLRLGSLSTRTTHPFYIARWNELLQTLGFAVLVENPYWDKTKGEMVAECQNRSILHQLIPASLSCASPSKARWVGHSTEHCGYCLPCIIRRASLKKGLNEKDPTPYTLQDLTAAPLKTSEAKGLQVRSFQVAINRLKSQPALADLLIHKPGPLTDESPQRQQALAQVYLRGMMEVADLLKGVRTEP
jgi:hypothetical protein